jgi:DNA-directed RNA polymerase specialized sigma subunit
MNDKEKASLEKLAKYYASTYRHVPYDDIWQICCKSFLEAKQRYRSDGGATLLTLAITIAKRKVVTFCKTQCCIAHIPEKHLYSNWYNMPVHIDALQLQLHQDSIEDVISKRRAYERLLEHIKATPNGQEALDALALNTTREGIGHSIRQLRYRIRKDKCIKAEVESWDK